MHRTCNRLSRTIGRAYEEWRESNDNALAVRTAYQHVQAKPAELNLDGIIAKAERATSVPAKQQSAFNEMRGGEFGDVLNKASKHSIETVKYGFADDLEGFGESGEQYASHRDMPVPEKLTMFDDPFKRKRVGAIEEDERRIGPAAAAAGDTDTTALATLDAAPAPATQSGPQVAITYVNPYHVPDVLRGTDQCPGCGALMQCREQFAPGYTPLLQIKKHVEQHDRMIKCREMYYTRQERLHDNVKKTGWQPGMEFQDYMTEEEMHAVHTYQPSPVVCERCTQIAESTFNSKKQILAADDWAHELAGIKDTNSLVVFVVSLWDFEGSFAVRRHLQRFLGSNDVLMIGTHADTLPFPWGIKKHHPEEGKLGNLGQYLPKDEPTAEEWQTKQYGLLSDYMLRRCKKEQFRVRDGIAVGIRTGQAPHNLETAVAAIEHWRRGRDVYVVGGVNVGKSSFINELYARYKPAPAPHPAAEFVTEVTGSADNPEYSQRWVVPENAAGPEKALALTMNNPFERNIAVSSSRIPGTTMKNMAFTIHSTPAGGGPPKKAKIIDTPGVVSRKALCNVLPLSLCSEVTPKGRMSYKFFELQPGSSLFLGALVRVDVLKAPAEGVLIQAVARWTRIKPMITPTAEADIAYEKLKGVRLTPPNNMHTLTEIGGLTSESVHYMELTRKDTEEANEIVAQGICNLTIAPRKRKKAAKEESQYAVVRVVTVAGVEATAREPMQDLRNTLPFSALLRGKRSNKHVGTHYYDMVAAKHGVRSTYEAKWGDRIE